MVLIIKIPEAKQKPNGTWYIQLRLQGQSYYVQGENRKDVEAEAYYIKSTHATGRGNQHQVNKTITLRQACKGFIKDHDKTLSPSTLRGYTAITEYRFQSVMDKPIANINNWQSICNKEARTVSAKTLKNAWGFIHKVLSDNGISVSVTLPDVEVTEKAFLSPSEIKVFCNAVKGKRIEIPALLALHSLRRSELLALDWANVDLENRRIYVKGAAVFDADNHLTEKKTNKNKTSTRIVPIIIPQLYDALLAVETKQGKVVNYSANEVWRQVNNLCERNNLPKVGVHGLRHSFASLAYSVGMSEKATMKIGGWSDYGTMRKIYTHLADEDLEKQITAMRNFFE